MAQVRIGHSLSDGEKNYLCGRKLSVQKCLVKNNIPCTLSTVPNIAILGSGGGQRATVGMLSSLYQMGKQGLLDAALYMSGVSGSTWCMASIYERPNWSSDIKQIQIVAERLGHDSVSLMDRVYHLVKYYRENKNFSLTDVWAALVVPLFVKKIDPSTLSNYQTCHDKDPYPIFTVINQDCKYGNLLRESFFELTPHEAGYTLAGAFVETSSFGSIFNNGVLKKKEPEMDMTYLQGLCGSAPADNEVLLKILKEWLEGKMGLDGRVMQVNIDVKNSTDQKEQIQTLTSDICQSFFDWIKDWDNSSVSEELLVFVKTFEKVTEKPPDKPVDGNLSINAYNEPLKTLIDLVKELLDLLWIWGTNYNCLQNMEAPGVNHMLLKSETSHFEDAGLLVNSPYMSALRAEREIDLIISFDFSDGNPMETVTKTLKQCKDLGISFPAINVTESDVASPKSFYVFKGVKKAPTVIHMPLFNIENCGSNLEYYRQKYSTFQGPYSPEMIEELTKKAGENVINNKDNLLREIESIVKQK
ncbi:unnamed protein product [Lota lota]